MIQLHTVSQLHDHIGQHSNHRQDSGSSSCKMGAELTDQEAEHESLVIGHLCFASTAIVAATLLLMKRRALTDKTHTKILYFWTPGSYGPKQPLGLFYPQTGPEKRKL